MLAKKCAQAQNKLEVPAKGNIGFQNYIVLLSRTLLAHPSLSSLIFQYKPCHRLRLFITFPRFCGLIHNCHPNITKSCMWRGRWRPENAEFIMFGNLGGGGRIFHL